MTMKFNNHKIGDIVHLVKKAFDLIHHKQLIEKLTWYTWKKDEIR